MRGVDLSLFQFDYDLTWAGFFMEPDGTVLGRYGAGSRDSMHYNSIPGLKNAMKRALQFHQNIDELKPALVAKNQKDVAFKFPKDLPSKKIREILKGDTARKNCIHCHTVQAGLNEVIASKPGYHPDQIRSLFPAPERLGVVLDVDHGLKVKRVIPQSAAAMAGVQVGDELTHAMGQPLLSNADFIWALRSVDDPGVANLVVKRGDTSKTLAVPLKKGWKPADIAWRTSVFDMRPQLRLWVEKANKSQRRKAHLKDDELGLDVRGVFGAEVKKAGFRSGDLVVAVGPWHPNVGANDFAQHIRVHYYQKGAKIPITVIRGSRRLTLVAKF